MESVTPHAAEIACGFNEGRYRDPYNHAQAADRLQAYEAGWQVINRVMFNGVRARDTDPLVAAERLLIAHLDPEYGDLVTYGLHGYLHKSTGSEDDELIFGRCSTMDDVTVEIRLTESIIGNTIRLDAVRETPWRRASGVLRIAAHASARRRLVGMVTGVNHRTELNKMMLQIDGNADFN